MRTPALLLALSLLPVHAAADEGMWTFDGFPSEKVERKYGFRPSREWLDHVQRSSARLAQGCSASFVSQGGLVMTNHHCAHACIEELSTAGKDLVRDGFHAPTVEDELRCPELEVNQLLEITDVTARMHRATAGREGERFVQAERAEMAALESACQRSEGLRCDVVALYHGGKYGLYKYRRFQDVRLVFAPELAIAFFGGDPDNFEFPRYALDVAFLRVYEGGRPARLDHWFRWSPAGAGEGELTFVSGNPGGTSRELTVAQLEYARDASLPDSLLRMAELRGQLTEYRRRGPEQARHASGLLFHVENALKAYRGRLEALRDARFFGSRVQAERDFKARAAAAPGGKAVLAAFDAIAAAQGELRKLRKPLNYQERGLSFSGDLFRHARTLVRAAEERAKPDGKRLPEYHESALPALTQALFSTAPIHDELEKFQLTFSLTKMREELGADDPFVKKVLGETSPEELADRLVRGTRLKDVASRRRLWEGGQEAVRAAAKDDPLVALALAVDPEARAVRKKYEDEVESVVKRSSEAIAKARFRVRGLAVPPDATFTPRLSYGAVEGWVEDGKPVKPFTTFEGAFARHTGREPFALPRSWLEAKPRLDLGTRLNLTTTNDIIGGNSGSPLFDREARIVGLVFDGNIHSLGGDYGFDPALNRAISVHSAAIEQALSRIYGAERLVKELTGAAGAPRTGGERGASAKDRG